MRHPLVASSREHWSPSPPGCELGRANVFLALAVGTQACAQQAPRLLDRLSAVENLAMGQPFRPLAHGGAVAAQRVLDARVDVGLHGVHGVRHRWPPAQWRPATPAGATGPRTPPSGG